VIVFDGKAVNSTHFDHIIQISSLSSAERLTFLNFLLSGHTFDITESDLQDLSLRTGSFSLAELAGLLRIASFNSFSENDGKIVLNYKTIKRAIIDI